MTLRFEVFPLDRSRCIDFYTRVLRFRLRTEGQDGYASLVRDGVRIGISPRPDAVDPRWRRPPTGTELVLEVDDLDAEYAAVVDSGWPIDAPVLARPWGLRDFRILDADGYYLRITDRYTVGRRSPSTPPAAGSVTQE